MHENKLSGFVFRHIGPNKDEISTMLASLGYKDLEDLSKKAIPSGISFNRKLDLPMAQEEHQALQELKQISQQNKIFKNYIGQGYYGTIVPGVIQRNILENPGWYTQYTPYQAEISQGRMEALLNFQTLVSDMCSLPVANASLLDEATAAAEAMAMAYAMRDKDEANIFWVDKNCFAQSIAVLKTRAEPLGITIQLGDVSQFKQDDFSSCFGAFVQYPDAEGKIFDPSLFVEHCQSLKIITVVATDLMALCLLKSPGEMGADIAVGSAQRFGVPLGFGGPHAAFMACKEEFKRKIPGRIIGVSKDRHANPALRLALQTREQHIRRDKATSNICTAQVLLAVMSSMYSVYHGPKGLRTIAKRIHEWAHNFSLQVKKHSSLKLMHTDFFDTLCIQTDSQNFSQIKAKAESFHVNLHYNESQKKIFVAFDECSEANDFEILRNIFGITNSHDTKLNGRESSIPVEMQRVSTYLTHPVFNSHHTETKMLRYIRKLESKDLSLTRSMIPLGSCTMKLNATSELFPVTWPEFSNIHPFAPSDQTKGYERMLNQLESYLAEITGFDAISLQPNAGSQGEYAGLLVIRAYHKSRNEHQRDICLIPKSAHGTNPASAVMAGMKVQVVDCDAQGNVDVEDLKKKIDACGNKLSALMITYPSTHGVFEEAVQEICKMVHDAGGQVYMDGANMNAQVALCRPGDFGPDVCHLNLHKTFCIPHGGGGPGMGPIGVKKHLEAFLPGHPQMRSKSSNPIGPVSAAPWGSASILPISWMYIRMMGAEGLKLATQVAILNANYIAQKLSPYFPILYRAKNGLVAHECIIDLQSFRQKLGIEVEDVAKRLMDYGFHAPTVSFPVPHTMMIEPTESESLDELDRFCEAMISIHSEIKKVESGEWAKDQNPLKNAPHTAGEVSADVWTHKYSREVAVFPNKYSREWKFWPSVARVDNAYGDRNLVCTCLPIESYNN